MNSTYKIAVLGIGGVGGYLGGLFSGASLYPSCEVIFICRGENLAAIRKDGLKIITDQGENIYHPDIVTDTPQIIGPINLLLCCVKGFDLVSSLGSLADCITENTIIIPMLNGIDASEKIRAVYPAAKTWKGVIYLVSRLIAPGTIRQTGPLNQLYFGSKNTSDKELQNVEKLFLKARIKAQIADDIDQKIWEKFFFISSMATITSYYNCNIGEIQGNPSRIEKLKNLLLELEKVAVAMRISISSDLCEKTYNKIKGLPPETTSSMLSDFRKGGKNEIDELAGCVVELGKNLQVATPTYDKIFTKLKYSDFKLK